MKRETIRNCIKEQFCWICGKGGWKALSQHLWKKHGITASETRESAGLFKRDCLISPELSSYLSSVALEKFGEKRHVGSDKGHKKVLSTKAKLLLRDKARKIQYLTLGTHKKKPHNCSECGVVIPASRPVFCSVLCRRKNWSRQAREAITPERMEHFNRIRHVSTREELKAMGQKRWQKERERRYDDLQDVPRTC